jgi:drug/metabolite transporter (DMT)-like permease
VVQFAFGSSAVEGKLAMTPVALGGAGIPPEGLAMARMLGGALFLQGLAFMTRRMSTRTSLRDHLVLFGLSLLGITVNQTLFLFGLQKTTPVSAALLCVTIPVFTAAIAILMRQERPSVRFGLGLLLALGGAVALTGIRDVDRGAVLVLVNSLSYATYLVLGRNVIRRLGAITVIRWIFFWGALSFLPFGGPVLARAIPSLSTQGAILLVYMIVMPTIVAYLANAWALARSSATLVTIYIYLQPLIAAALGYVQLGQPLAPRAIVAAALILLGVTVVATR